MRHAEERATLEAFGSTALVAVTDAGALVAAGPSSSGSSTSSTAPARGFARTPSCRRSTRPPGAAVHVGPVLLEAVTVALRAARLTDGDVDPTVGQALIALGYDRDFAELPVAVAGGVAVPGGRPLASVPGWRTVTRRSRAGTIRVARRSQPRPRRDRQGAGRRPRGGGGAAPPPAAACSCRFGGDLAIAGPAPAEGWRVRVTDDHRSGFDAPGQWISLSSGGLATSSTAVRRWRDGHRGPPIT